MTTTVILAIVVVILVAVLDHRKLLDKNYKRERWTSVTLLIIGVALSILQVTEVKIPSPYQAIEFVYKPISDLFYSWLS